MLVGATLEKLEIPYWESKLPINDWMRVFPNSDGMIPALSDNRFDYAQRVNMNIIFVSTKIHTKFVAGNHGTFQQGLDNTRQKLIDLANGGFDLVYYTDQHEPEGDMTPDVYKANMNLVFDMIDGLPSEVRAKVRAGHALTRQWTENTPGRTYLTHDTGRGDFFGVDFYGNSWDSDNSSNATDQFVDPVVLLSRVKAYKFDSSDNRPRIFPELGYIGAPFDVDGSARAAWIAGIYQQLKTWGPATTGWNFDGFVWWNTEGKSGTSLNGTGTKRWFQLDRRHTGTDGSYEILNPPLALIKFNEIAEDSTSPNEETIFADSMEIDWEVWSNCTLSYSPERAKIGTHSIKVRSIAAGHTLFSNKITIPVVPGQTLEASAYFRAEMFGRGTAMQMNFYADDGSLLAQPFTTGTDNPDEWTATTVTAVAPAGSARVVLIPHIYDLNQQPDEIHYVDDIKVDVAS